MHLPQHCSCNPRPKTWTDARRATTETDIASAKLKLERELAEKGGEITQAVDALEIYFHPTLFRVYEDICVVEGGPAPVPPTEISPATA